MKSTTTQTRRPTKTNSGFEGGHRHVKEDNPKAFVEHLHDLRRHVVHIVVSIIVFSTLAYFVQQQVVDFLLAPSKGQELIYTSPVGGVNFLFSLCMYVGIAASTPVIIYHFLDFFKPLIPHNTRVTLLKYSVASVLLGATGFFFGYYVGLPAAFNFLQHQFTSNQISALFTLNEYLSFLAVYLLGSIAIFQLPLIILFINRIKPMSPKKMLSYERHVIVGAIVMAMIMVPSPNVLDQLVISGPVILMYNLSILIVHYINKKQIIGGLYEEQRFEKLLEELDEEQKAPKQDIFNSQPLLDTSDSPQVSRGPKPGLIRGYAVMDVMPLPVARYRS